MDSTSSDGEVAAFDTQFPPEEVPHIYESGHTELLISPESDMLLTGERRTKTKEADATDHSNSQTQNTESTLTVAEIKQRMNALDQIQMERQVKQHIKQLNPGHTPNQKQRLAEFDDIFDSHNPGKIETWMEIWDYFNQDYDTGIPAPYLPKAVMAATGFTASKADDAVTAGDDFDLLVTADQADTETLPDDIDADEYYRLPLPMERPHLYLDSPQQYAERETWETIWNVFGDTSVSVPENSLKKLLIKNNTVDHDKGAKTALSIGNESGALSQTPDDKYKLAAEHPESLWLDVWDGNGSDYNTRLPKEQILICLRIELIDSDIEADDRFNTAVETGELYSPTDAATEVYRINDPATDAGPEITPTAETQADPEQERGSNTPDTNGADTAENGATTAFEYDNAPEKPANAGDEAPDDSSVTSAETMANTPTGQPTPTTTQADTSGDGDTTADETAAYNDQRDTGPQDDQEEGNSNHKEDSAIPDEMPTMEGGTSVDVGQQADPTGEESQTTTDTAASSTADSESETADTAEPENVRDNAPPEDSQSHLQAGSDSDGHNSSPDTSGSTDQDMTNSSTATDGNLNDSSGSQTADNSITVSIDDGENDPDRQALRKFVTHRCQIHEDDTIKIRRSTMMNAFVEWANRHGIADDLDRLSLDVYIDNRKGQLKTLLGEEFDIECSQRKIEGENAWCYIGIKVDTDLIHTDG